MDATQPGVADEQEPIVDAQTDDQPNDQAPPPGSPAERRMAAMDAIGTARTAELAEEMGAVPAEPEPEPERQVDVQLADDEFLDPSMLNRKVKLRIDGQDVVLPLEQVVRTAQKSEAADRRLQQATELLRQAQGQAQRSEETTGNIPSSAPAGLSQDETDRPKLKAALDAIFSGDEDAAIEAFSQVLGRRQPQAAQADPDQMAEIVAQRLDERSALGEFLKSYPRIAANPWLQAAADAELSRLREEGSPFREALDQAGKVVYQQFGYEAPRAESQKPSPTTNRRETLEARKAGLDIPVGRTVSAEQSRVAPESSESQRSLTISEMAAARRGAIPAAARR